MCGFAGFFSPKGFNESQAKASLENMTNAIIHRGPDDSGIWIDGSVNIALGHRRLSIIDLSAAGHQPMVSVSNRFIILFNGEIYNHLEIRKNLGNFDWRGHSDVETLLVAIEQWGLKRALKLSVGMFAIALWDRELKTLSLARDRMGEKPLYYGWQGNTFLFGSELKAIRQHPEFVGEVDRNTLEHYVRHGYVPTPNCIYKGLNKLKPGTILKIETTSIVIGSLANPESYWSLNDVIKTRADNYIYGDPRYAVDALEKHLLAAIKLQQIADVPIGAFLSGGVDSSTVVALMQSISGIPIKTFTIGFNEESYNEATYARAVASHLHTDHTELYVTAKQAMDIIPLLPSIYDEPFADASQIPTVLLSQLTRKHVTVAISGDGGDELFCGYGRYEQTVNAWKRLSKLPLPVRSLMQHCIPNSAISEGIASKTIDKFYNFMNLQWKGYPNLVIGSDHPISFDQWPNNLDDAKERMMYSDAMNYLPDDILVKVDRAAMSASLETRVPLLDHNVVEFAWQLPIGMKFNQSITKWPLRQIFNKHLPRHLADRPKMGFGVPIDHWLRGPLRGWAEELLSEDRLKFQSFFDPLPIRRYWQQHLSGRHDRHYYLWTILMFQAWLITQEKKANGT